MRKSEVAAFLITLLICCHSLNASAAGQDQDHYLDLLVEQALKQNLSQERLWHLLLHYKKTLFRNSESEEDAPAFFNSPIGKTDPQAELIATLRSFSRSPESLPPGEEHPQCNFPARYKWLKSELSFDPARLPEQRCERLEAWLKDLNPEKITLVFASYYMNNPASMFGHTFLRIDKKREGPQQKLLDYGVNYAATADTKNPLIYTIKGVFGGFTGTFSIFPYYFKIQEYSNLESRDLWEYEMSFTEDQMNYLLLHLWELGGNYFNYYYFQENCSYHILSLLEVANPDLYLTDQFLFHVIPSDTVRAVTRYNDLVSKRVYRPSLLSQMNHKQLQMTHDQKKIFYRLTKDPSWIEKRDYQNLTVPEKALVLDAYLDYAQYKNMQKENKATVIDQATRAILLERSRLDYQRSDPQETTQFSSPPELGHGSARIKIGTGRNDTESFEEISLRPAYHDLLAKDLGFSKNSQILFLDLTVRYYNDSQKTKLDRFKLIDIISLTPYDSLFRRMSWRLSIGTDTIKDLDCDYCNSFRANYGIGISYKTGYLLSVLLYSLFQVDGELSTRLSPNYRLGGGGTIGALWDITKDWRIQIAGDYLSFPLGDESHYYKVSVNQRYSITQNLDLRAEFSTLNSKKEWLLAANYYF